uniref:(northern house mosquito) hypothetical protein n=1 Tax=Culex pipiens TaxID=7175 RepID=A0A8D8KX08_CULPI
MLVQTVLLGLYAVAHPELKVSHMASGQLDPQRDDRSRLVPPHNHSLAPLATKLVRSWPRDVESVPTFTALAVVLLPLPVEPAAVQLVVVVVRWRRESVPPGRGSTRWFYEASVATAQADQTQQE